MTCIFYETKTAIECIEMGDQSINLKIGLVN